MIVWLALALAQDAPEPPPPTEDTPVIRPDDGRPTESIDVGGERGERGIKRRVDPVFPDEARKAGLSYGRCEATVDVDVKGVPGKPIFGDCPEVFRRSALEALRQWRWHPGEDGETRVIIDYRDESAAALLADPDPLETPMLEFGMVQDERAICVGHATISEDGKVLDKSANRLPDCIFEPGTPVAVSSKPLSVLASCTASFVTDRGYAMKIKYGECTRSVKAATGKNLRSWTWPWTPGESVEYEMTLTFLAD